MALPVLGRQREMLLVVNGLELLVRPYADQVEFALTVSWWQGGIEPYSYESAENLRENNPAM